MHKLLLLVTLISLLTACSLGGEPVPADHFYRIPQVVLSPQAKPVIESLVIKPVKASGLYHERAMLYIEKSRPLEIHRNHYHFWYKPPADLMFDALYQGLTSAKVSRNVSRVPLDDKASYIIDSQIMQFERVVDGDAVSVQLGLEITVSSPGLASGQWSRLYESRQSVQTNDKHASVEAYGVALEDIMRQILNDLLLKK